MILLNTLANVQSTGYGGASNNLALALLGRGVNCRTALLPGERANVHIYFGQLYDAHLEHPSCSERRADILAVFTMYESSALPQDWVDKMNKMFDLVLVPSTWCAESFKACGVTKPIAVVPLGFNPHEWPVIKRPVLPNKLFTYYWQGFKDVKDRKGGNLVQAAFEDLRRCGDIPANDTRLIMKSVPLLISSMTQDARVDYELFDTRTIIKSIAQHELIELLREADVSFNPASGEGFGLIPLEHMATGTPVFAPYATGMTEYLVDGTYFPLKTKMMDAIICDPSYERMGQIPRPYYDDVREKMLWAYDHRDELADVGIRGANHIRSKYTYAHTAIALINALNIHCGYDEFNTWVAPEPERQTVREYSI